MIRYLNTCYTGNKQQPQLYDHQTIRHRATMTMLHYYRMQHCITKSQPIYKNMNTQNKHTTEYKIVASIGSRLHYYIV